MRVLVAHPGPQFSVADVYTGWTEGLAATGAQVFQFNLGDRLAFYDSALLPAEPDADSGQPQEFRKALTAEQAIQLATNGLAAALFKLRPHVLLSVSTFFTDTDLLDQARRLGTKVVLLHTESPYEDGRQLALAPHADVVLLNDPTNLAEFERHAQTAYMPHAYRPQVHRPGPVVTQFASDLIFVGTGYPSRIRFLEQMDLTGVDVLLAGNWQLAADSPLRPFVGHDLDECLDNTQAVELYRSAKVGLNLYRREAETEQLAAGWAMGPREVEMAACGLFFLRDPRGESDEVFPMLPSFTSPGEAAELLRWWLPRDGERQELAGKAAAAVADRTFEAHAARLLRLLDLKE